MWGDEVFSLIICCLGVLLLSAGNAVDGITVVTSPRLGLFASDRFFILKRKATYCECQIRGNGCGCYRI